MKTIIIVAFTLVAIMHVSAQTVTGPENVCADTDYSYTYTDDAPYNSVNWSVTGGAVVGGSDLSRVVRWSASGRVTVTLYWNGVVTSSGTMNVNTFRGGIASGPSMVCAGSAATIITTGYNDGGMSIYWQSSSDGIIFTTLSAMGPSITVSPSVPTWYRATVGSCRTSASNAIKLNVQSSPAPSFTSGPSTVCVGTSGHVYTTQPGMSGYVWAVSSGGTITAGGSSSSSSVTVLWSTAGTKSVSVNYSVNGCASASPVVRSVNVVALPVPTIASGPTSVCVGSSGNTYTTQAGASNYVWTVGGGTVTSGGSATSNSVSITWNTAGAKLVKVSYSNSAGCTASSNASLSVTVNPAPAPTITSGPVTACAGSTGNVYVTQPGMTNYVWTVSGGVITAGGGLTSNVATVTWTSAGSRSVSVSYTNSLGCVAIAPAVAAVTVNPIPTPVFTAGPTSACAGSTSNIYTTQPGMSNYIWSASTGGTITAGGTSESSTVTVTWNSAGSRSVSVNYSSNGCTAAQPTIRNVVVQALPAPTFTAGPTTVCVGSSANLYATQPGMSNYVWSISDGGSITSGGSGSSTATITWSSIGARTVRVNYSNTAGCSAANPTNLAVTVNSLPAPSFTAGPLAVCAGSTGNVYTTQPGMSNYIWTVSTGGTITSGGGTTSSSATVTWSTAGQRSVAVTYSNSSECTGTSVVANVTVKALPVPTFTAGPTTVCAASIDNVYATQSGMSNYVWIVSGGAITSGGGPTHNTVKVTWPSAGTRTVSVRYADPNACVASSPVVRTVTVNALPMPTFTSGPTAVCQGAAIYSTQAGMSNYVWSTSAGGTITAGTSTNTVTVAWQGTGNQTVSVSYAASGCLPASPAVRSVAVSSPSMGGAVSPVTREHYGTSNSGSLTLSGHTGSVLRWEKKGSSGWITINNTSSTYNYQDIGQATAFRAVVRNGVCGEASSLPAQVNIYSAPVVVASQRHIPYGGTVRLAVNNGYHSFRWYLNGSLILGASLQTYEAKQPGAYKVEATASGASVSGFSQPVNVASSLDVIDKEFKANLHSVSNVMMPGATPTTNLFALGADQIQQAISYQDGLGRTLQSIAVGQSPRGLDVVLASAYNRYGFPDTTYLPYTTNGREGAFRRHAIHGERNAYATSEQRNYYQTFTGVTHDDHPYAVTVTGASPLMNVKEQGAPGIEWQPNNGHTLKKDVMLNLGGQVRLWKPDGSTAGYYPANALIVTQVTNEDGNRVQVFTDKFGRTILHRVEADGNIEGLTWLETYNVYDGLGRIRWQVSPKAVALLDANPALASDSSIAELIFKYAYDTRGRLIEKKVPGSQAYAYVYDNLDRLVLTNESQADRSNWIFSKYDDRGRLAYTGVWSSGTKTRAILQGELDAIDYDVQPWFEAEQTGPNQGYTHRTYPQSGSQLVVNFYDHYDFDRDGTDDVTYDASHMEGQEQTTSKRTRGLLTGTKTRVVDENGLTSAWLWTAIFYDKFDRPIQIQGNSIQFAGGIDKQTAVYDFVKPLRTKTTHNSAPGVAIDIVDRIQTDHAGRALKIYRQINADDEQLVVAYDYNELGQLVARKLHGDDDGNYLQTVNLSYTIRGWLERINDPATPGDDFFAQEIFYNANLGGLQHKPQWSGGITATTWRDGFGNGVADDQKSLTYNFSRNGQLKDSKYAGGASFSEDVGVLNEERLVYDANGNIRSMVRKGRTELGLIRTIDSLTYSYHGANPNQLVQVEDATQSVLGFRNGAASTSEFRYDGAGNQVSDENKGISSISYNVLNKVSRVKFSDGREIRYSYDAAGTKLVMNEYQGSTLRKSTRYAGQFVYEDGKLQFFGSPEGRIVVKEGEYEFQYAIGDRQGNTRVVFTSRKDSLEFTATFETLSSGRRRDTDLFDNVIASNEVNSGAANTTPGGGKVYRMNQSNPAGAALMLRVYPGDELDPEVWAYHESNSGYGSNSIGLSAMIAAVAGSFGGVQGGEAGGGLIYETFREGLGIIGLGGNRGSSKPAAYLNYIFFDDVAGFDPQLQGDRGESVPVPDGAYFNKTRIQFTDPIRIAKPGYIYIYLSYENQSNNYVYFDDLKVNYTKSPVIQSNTYYAFGLLTADSWTRVYTPPNKYLYNGASELNEVTGNYEMFFRGYDPALGRMNGVDIMAASYASLTPYNYAFNNPAYFNDQNGADPLTSERGGYSYGSLGGCNCWRDWGAQGAQDYGGEARGASMAQSSGIAGGYDITIVMDELVNGVYVFDFTDGNVSNFEYYGEGEFLGFGDATMRGILGFELASESLPGGLESNASATCFRGMPYTESATSASAGKATKSTSSRVSSPSNTSGETNYIVRAIHQGQRDFENHPAGGVLLAFLSGAAMEGVFVVAKVVQGARVGKGGVTVIGEGMKRVSTEAAKIPGAVILNNMPRFFGTKDQITSQMMAYNRKWILEQARTGRDVIDFGLDPGREIPSIFFQMEQHMLKNYLKLYPKAFQIFKL